MRNFQRPDYSATMWKTFYLHLLILFTIDFPRDRFTGAEPIRLDTELVTRNDEHNYRLRDNDMRGRITSDHYPPRANLDEDKRRTSELVGKWRSTGEALEPKWRDGDNVPLLPFSHFSQYSKEELETSEHEDYQNRQRSSHPRQKDRGPYYREKSDGRTIYSDSYRDYDLIENERRYEDDQDFYRNSRPSIALMASVATVFEKEKDDPVKHVTPATYQEALQNRPNNNYEHELDDEEYLRPRPRKRRPPQNYEFVLAANEALLRNQNMQAAHRSQSRDDTHGNSANRLPTNTSIVLEKKDNVSRTGTSEHAVQLKTLLKMQQEEGLSLSEILQRRNLTLNDLLKGKADVISALKSKDIDESDEYVEEVSRIMSNSIKKISTTETPHWQSTLEAAKLEDSKKESLPVRGDVSESKVLSTTSSDVPVLVENSVDNGRISSNDINQFQTSSTTERTKNIKSIIVTLNPFLIKSTTPAGNPMMLTTSTTSSTSTSPSTPIDIATNSMEFFQNDDSSVTIGKNRDLKKEKSEEDEIMEFSDFPDYRKEKNAVIPIWLVMEKEVTTKSADEKGMDKQRDTGSTLSIEQFLSSTERAKILGSPKTSEPIEIDLTDIKSDKSSENKYESTEKPADDYSAFLEHEYQDDAPVMPYDLEDISTLSFLNNSDTRTNMESHGNRTKSYQSAETGDLETNARNKSPKNHQDTIVKEKPYEDIISEIEPEARAEIFELFASSSAGKRLERLLKSRNMSIDELIALRQRGSSKVHLAEISRLRVSTPSAHTSTEESNEDKTRTSSDTMKPELNSRNIEIDINDKTNVKQPESNLYIRTTWLENKTNNVLTSNSMNLNDLDARNTETSTDVDKHGDNNAVNIYDRNESFQRETGERIPKRMEEIVDLLTTFASLPFARNIKRNLTADVMDYDNLIKKKLITQSSDVSTVTENNSAEVKDTNDATNIIESGYVEQVEKDDTYVSSSKELKTTANHIDEEDSSYDDKRTLSKVKPSIIASGVILGVTIVVFLAILIACRIRQKQRYRYRNAFSKAVFQGPINAARKLSNSSSLSTVMVNVVAMSTTKRPGKNEAHGNRGEFDSKSDIDNDSLDANDSWETIPDYMK